MGKITVSLSDDLEARVDAYAAEHQLPVSQVVARALEAWLAAGDQPAPSPPGPAPPPSNELQLLRYYMDVLAGQSDDLRESVLHLVARLGLPPDQVPVPPPVPPPPWWPSP